MATEMQLALRELGGVPSRLAVRYAGRHGERALTPLAVMSAGAFTRSFPSRRILPAIRRLRSFGDYVQSGTDADDPATRTARTRADMEALLFAEELHIPAGSLDPFPDYIAAKLAAERIVRKIRQKQQYIRPGPSSLGTRGGSERRWQTCGRGP
jgi:hypothetical protein